MTATVAADRHVGIARFSETNSDLLEGGRTFREFGALYGRRFTDGRSTVSLAAGASRVTCEDVAGCGTTDRGGNALWSRDAFGIPIQAQISIPLTSFLGMGLQGFSNLNPIESYAGAGVMLQIGKLR